MMRFSQSPTDPAFVQNPYPFYDRLRAAGDLAFWDAYGLCAVSHRAVHALLRDRRFGREIPAEQATPVPEHLAPFYAIEAHSMLELEPPRHTRLRGLVLRAFTTRRIAALGPEIAALSHKLIDAFPDCPVDLLPAFCQPIPVIVIARLLGVPDAMAPQLLDWSNAMVAMYQARRTRAIEDAAARASADFTAFLTGYIAERRKSPRDDLLSHLIAAEEAGDRLSTEELTATCILLLNAGHEATVHTMGNGLKTLLETGHWIDKNSAAQVAEEILRHDPPLHLFTRYAYEEAELFGHRFRRGDKVALLLGAANRDPAVYPDPARFDPARRASAHHAFGGGLHFCVGAPLARLELQTALPILFARLPGLRLADPPRYADLYHFHGLERLLVETG
ncbi:cytochrome P450 [Salipiger sp. P9]|uniref:cytochrome P450 n=1 Tax=Salipiger pentaromativorans TaxID=2943193 RepID=UPI002158791B|nr:cytochrome P450 [Salipiger pentaromativorans]MCR8547058.1 cytochrome P450 [Salipiger pentaromativorans]